jgi:Tfp pilus assembly PilM family ATPase
MSRLFAIEWDAAEARVATGRARTGGGLILEHAFTVELPQAAAGGPEVGPKEIGERIAKALAERGLSRGEALVAVGRTSIELRFLTLPPMPPEELPDSVRLQAVRQFSTLGEDWPLDFVPLDSNKDGGTNVLAAAISPELVKQTQETCAAANLTFSRLVLRPFAAAALVKKLAVDGKCRLTIDFQGEEADLSVLAGEKLVFPRTVRLPSGANAETLARALVAEVRRTVVAAQNQLGGRRVEQVIIFGDSTHHESLRALLQQELSLDGGVQLLDPLAQVEHSRELQASPPRNPGAFAPVLGMLLDEAASAAPGIDFLHPRKRPVPKNNRRLYIGIGATAAAVLLIFAGYITFDLRQRDSQIANLRKEKAALELKNKKGKTLFEQTKKIDEFVAGDANWLDELRVLSEKAPPPEKARIDAFLADTRPSREGGLQLDALMAGPEVVPELENAMRDERHTVEGFGGKKDEKAVGLKWRVREDIVIAPTDPTAPPPKKGFTDKGKAPPTGSKGSPKGAASSSPAKAAPSKAASPKGNRT